MRKKKLRSPTDYNTSRLLEAELHLSRDIAQAKSNYESKLIYAKNQSRIYQYIRSLRKSDAYSATISYNDSIANDDTIKASLSFSALFSLPTPNDDDAIDTSVTKQHLSNQHLSR